MTHATIKAPAHSELPQAKRRPTRGGPELREIEAHLEVVTPIFGGSYQTREIDDIDKIRVPSIRGHLRFWWRALYGSQYSSTEELYKREGEIWGRATEKKDPGGRSAVEIRVSVTRCSDSDRSDIHLQTTIGAYALWPARAETTRQTDTAPRRKPGTQFKLLLKVPATLAAEVTNVLRAWILFGGYGGRTRRGLGSLKVLGDTQKWLPSIATREALTSLFGTDVFAAPEKAPSDVPWLGGAAMHIDKPKQNAEAAWTTALRWLQDFRQGTSGGPGNRAREPGPNGNAARPSTSNWPEADKVRRHSQLRRGVRWAHTPRHNGTPAWPRAGFGLPINGQFQSKSREEHPTRRKHNGKPDEKRWDELPETHPNYGIEPNDFELRWRSPTANRPREWEEHDRLASPLIVKALPLADGTFVPCALWLNRGYPRGGEVGLSRPIQGRPNEKAVVQATVAPFDRLVADGDTPRFSALANKKTLRAAFLDWLRASQNTTVVAP